MNSNEKRQQDNKKLGFKLLWIVGAALLFGFALVPLYNVLCTVTGLNGKTNVIADVTSNKVDETRWVTVEFTVERDGSVEDAVVVEAEPADIFDDAALTAIRKWRFKEKIVDGVPVTQRAVQKLTFKLEQ